MAKACSQLQSTEMIVNYVNTSDTPQNKWLIDFANSHNINGGFTNLSINTKYDYTDEVVLGYGIGLAISHIGSLDLPTPKKTFHLHNTLCVPNFHNNLISIHQFTKHNDDFIEFHPSYFLMMKCTTGTILLKGVYENGIYMFLTPMVKYSSPKMVANVHE